PAPRPNTAATPHTAPRQSAPIVELQDTIFARYAGSAACKECHSKEFELWQPSHHALAERGPDATLDATAFDPPRAFTHGTQRTEVRTQGQSYEVTSHGPAGEQDVRKIERVIGHDPLRQFL